MKTGTENRTKTIAAGALGAAALCAFSYFLYSQFFATPSTPPPTSAQTAPATGKFANNANTTKALLNDNGPRQQSTAAQPKGPAGLGAVPGVAAERIASTSASLDPTLDESAMLRTEGLVYAGTGRNIFSAVYTPPVVVPKNVPKVRPQPPLYVPPVQPQPPPTCPPSCPPIPLKFFGTVTRAGKVQAFLLSGEDVYLAAQGDIVVRRYKVNAIRGNSVEVEDLTNHFSQTLPLMMQ